MGMRTIITLLGLAMAPLLFGQEGNSDPMIKAIQSQYQIQADEHVTGYHCKCKAGENIKLTIKDTRTNLDLTAMVAHCNSYHGKLHRWTWDGDPVYRTISECTTEIFTKKE